jgi:hypothetical protein
MGDLYSMTDLVVTFMKQFSFYGISLWFVFRTGSFLSIVVIPVAFMALSVWKGGGDD